MPIHEYDGNESINSNESFELHQGIADADKAMYRQESSPRRLRRFFSALAGFFPRLLEEDSPVDSYYPRRPT